MVRCDNDQFGDSSKYALVQKIYQKKTGSSEKRVGKVGTKNV